MYRFSLGAVVTGVTAEVHCTHPVITLLNLEEGVATTGTCERHLFC